MKYLVMECHFSYAVVLAEDGRMLNVANLHYEVGQTVTDVIEMKQAETSEEPSKTIGLKWARNIAAAMAACLVLVLLSIVPTQPKPYATIYVVINPEVKIEVDEGDHVIGLMGLNEDGEDLIKDYSYQNKPLESVLDELTDRSIDLGFLKDGGKISLKLQSKDTEWVSQHEDDLGTHMAEHVKEKVSVTIQVDGRQYGMDHVEIAIPDTHVEQVDDVNDDDDGITDYEKSDYEVPEYNDDADSDYEVSDYGDSDYEVPEYDDDDEDSDDDDSEYDDSDYED